VGSKLDQDEPGRIDALLHQGSGHRTGAGPKLRSTGPFRVLWVHIGRHGARARLGSRGVTEPIDRGFSIQERMKTHLVLVPRNDEYASRSSFNSATLQLEEPESVFFRFSLRGAGELAAAIGQRDKMITML